jgi:hypothetical protein
MVSALDKMMGKTSPSPAPGVAAPAGRPPSMMEAAMLKMLEGVGLDAGALAKVQGDVSAFALYVKAKLDKAEADNALILESNARIETNQAGILALLSEIADCAPPSQLDGSDEPRGV